eukprot:CAMPEP_0195611046 /NCGR_PEP_ID=MMETSP0815-20121206/10131_1 /TAXON_ID=97485 /ORGANISM="Prymnesium parvum, Strain Texoma1" /LENGTH=170 /DNA_ID=CAMNT_0040751071 /DNA_START=132 /DNA_END=641 /DNA_ORIENTATION=-
MRTTSDPMMPHATPSVSRVTSRAFDLHEMRAKLCLDDADLADLRLGAEDELIKLRNHPAGGELSKGPRGHLRAAWAFGELLRRALERQLSRLDLRLDGFRGRGPSLRVASLEEDVLGCRLPVVEGLIGERLGEGVEQTRRRHRRARWGARSGGGEVQSFREDGRGEEERG